MGGMCSLSTHSSSPPLKRLKLEYYDVAQWIPRLILRGNGQPAFGEKGPEAIVQDSKTSRRIGREAFVVHDADAGAPPTWPVAGTVTMRRAVGLYSAIVNSAYRRERTGKGSI